MYGPRCAVSNKVSASFPLYLPVHFTPNHVHISSGDTAVARCEVEYTEEQPPQAFMYVNDCKMLGYNQPTWITRIVESDGPCDHEENSPLCHTLTMYISGVMEAHNSRVYCCARLGSRACSRNTTISVLLPTLPDG